MNLICTATIPPQIICLLPLFFYSTFSPSLCLIFFLSSISTLLLLPLAPLASHCYIGELAQGRVPHVSGPVRLWCERLRGHLDE